MDQIEQLHRQVSLQSGKKSFELISNSYTDKHQHNQVIPGSLAKIPPILVNSTVLEDSSSSSAIEKVSNNVRLVA